MKKFAYIIIAASVAAAAVSCTKELDRPAGVDGADMVTFTATTAQTKTDIVEGHTVWSLDDQIKVFYNDGSAVAKLKTGEGTAKATFEAAVPDNADYYAVYPASIVSSKTGADELSVTIPQSQAGNFGHSHIAVAKGVNKAFAFANVNSFLKITLPEAGYKRIVVESPAGKPLSGSLNVKLQGDTAVASLGTDGTPSVEISSTAGFPAGDVYISVLPGVTHEKGLLVRYYDSDLKGSFYLDKEIVTEISTIHSFGEFGITGDYFVSLEGAGNKMGINAANAMDLTAFKAFMTRPEDAEKAVAWAKAFDGATIHMAAGEYDLLDSILVAFPGVEAPINVSFVGDNNTVITGNEGHRLLNVGENAIASFKNIKFEKGASFESRNSPILINGGATASFVNCTFTKNFNKKEDGVLYATGGCIYATEETTLSFDNCEFTYNRGSYGATLLAKGKVTIKDSHFQYNDGSWPGSALYLDHEDAVCEVSNTVFEDNTVTKEDGKKPDGGAILVCHGSLTMTGCSILRNSILTRRGGAIRSENASHVKLINCTVKENTADWGGAINPVNDSSLEIEGGLYEGNYSRGGGCILTANNASVSIKDAVFKENYLPKNGNFGGAIRHESNGPLTILRTSFEGNYTVYNGENEAFGGAVSISYDQKDAQVTIDGCSFIGNHSVSGGGAALSYQSSGDGGTGWMKVSNTIFKDNYNEYSGTNNDNYGRHAGAVRLGHDATPSYFTNCVFENNYTQTANKEIKSCYGGAVTFYADGMGYFNNCRFENNRATRGGAISVWNCQESGIFLNGCTFSGNWDSYKYGTTIYASRLKYFCMNNCSINDNTYTLASGEDVGNWVYIDGNAAAGDAAPNNTKYLTECVISNCSLIGSARTTADLTPLEAQELVYILDMVDGAKAYLINNSIIAAGTEQYSWWTNAVDAMGFYNVFSAKGNSSGSYTASGDTGNKSAADMGSLAWDTTNNVWSWNGTLAGGGNRITADAFATAIGSASANFKAWLEEIGALNKDQLGNARGTGEWWPGAYQKN